MQQNVLWNFYSKLWWFWGHSNILKINCKAVSTTASSTSSPSHKGVYNKKADFILIATISFILWWINRLPANKVCYVNLDLCPMAVLCSEFSSCFLERKSKYHCAEINSWKIDQIVTNSASMPSMLLLWVMSYQLSKAWKQQF